MLATAGIVTYVLYVTPNDAANSDASRMLNSQEEEAFTDLGGNPVSFESYNGKVRVVNSWASWSPYSVNELANFNTIATEYKDKNVVVIAINRKEPKETAERFLRTLPPLDQLHVTLDPDDSFFEAMDGFSMPETIIYDAHGTVFFHKHGAMSLDEMRQKVEEVLQSQN